MNEHTLVGAWWLNEHTSENMHDDWINIQVSNWINKQEVSRCIMIEWPYDEVDMNLRVSRCTMIDTQVSRRMMIEWIYK